MNLLLSKENLEQLLQTMNEANVKKYILQKSTDILKQKLNQKKLKHWGKQLEPFIDLFMNEREVSDNDWIGFLRAFQIPADQIDIMKDRLKEPYFEFKKEVIIPLQYIHSIINRRLQKCTIKPSLPKRNPSKEHQCMCGNYIIVPSEEYPYVVDTNDTIFSIIPPEHELQECSSQRVQGNFQICPNWQKERECILISGPSGAGKTFQAKEYLEKYKHIYPTRDIVLFANKPLEEFNFPYLHPSLEEEKVNEMKVQDFKNCILVFDDVENLTTNKKIQDKMVKFLEECLNIGRSLHISILIISHVLLNYRFSRNMIMECNKIIMFPTSGIRYQYKNFLERYLGLNKEQIDKLLNTNSRWLCIDKHTPICCITKNLFEIIT